MIHELDERSIVYVMLYMYIYEIVESSCNSIDNVSILRDTSVAYDCDLDTISFCMMM